MPGWFDELKVSLRYQVDDRELRATNRRLREHREIVGAVERGARTIGLVSTGMLAVTGRQLIEWDRVQNMIKATLGEKVNTEQLETLATTARKIARETSKTPEETALAQLELARAGLHFNEVMNATPHVVDLAIAAQMRMAEVSRLVIATSKAYNIEMADSERIVDGFAQTARNSLFSVHEFQAALRHAFPLAGTLGLEFEDTLAFMAAMREGGLAPEMVGTSLRNQIARLLNMTNKQKQAFTDMGVSWEWVQRTVAEEGGITEVFDEMLKKGADIIQLEAIFENRALAGGLIIMRSLEHIKMMGDLIREGKGATEDMREIMESNLYGAYKKAISAIQDFMLALGDAGLTEALRIIFEGLRNLVNALNALPGPFRTLMVLAMVLGSSFLLLGMTLRFWIFLLHTSFALALIRSTLNMWRLNMATNANTAATVSATAAGQGLTAWMIGTAIPAMFRQWFGLKLIGGALWFVIGGFGRALGAMMMFVAGAVAELIPAILRSVFGFQTMSWSQLMADLGFKRLTISVWGFVTSVVGSLFPAQMGASGRFAVMGAAMTTARIRMMELIGTMIAGMGPALTNLGLALRTVARQLIIGLAGALKAVIIVLGGTILVILATIAVIVIFTVWVAYKMVSAVFALAGAIWKAMLPALTQFGIALRVVVRQLAIGLFGALRAIIILLGMTVYAILTTVSVILTFVSALAVKLVMALIAAAGATWTFIVSLRTAIVATWQWATGLARILLTALGQVVIAARRMAAALLGPVVQALNVVIAKTIAWTIALLTNPIILAIIAIVALIALFVYAIVRWGDEIGNFFSKLWDGIKSGANKLFKWLIGMVELLSAVIMNSPFGWLIKGFGWVGNKMGGLLGGLFGGDTLANVARVTEPVTTGAARLASGIGLGPSIPPIKIDQNIQPARTEHYTNVERIDINAPGADPDEIARRVSQSLADQNEIAAAQHDSGVSG